jgi:hypothetical protein
MLEVDTFDNVLGGNVLYKALAHPIAAEKLTLLAARLKAAGPVSIYDPERSAGTLLALSPCIDVEGVYVHDSQAVGKDRGGHGARPLLELAGAQANAVLIAAFDAHRHTARVRSLAPGIATVATLDEVRLPDRWLTNSARYLDAVNFATNYAFFRDDDHFATRMTTLNYWSGYGARSVSLFLRLYDSSGKLLADWQQVLPQAAASVVIDSREVRRRFALPPFTGQLFIHVIGAAGHDVIKYALDTYATDGGESISCTHDANAWPADRYAGLPAPAPDERVILWLQNSHAITIPSGAMSLRQMGEEAEAAIEGEIPAFATRGLDVAALLPDSKWPSQIELLAGRHIVRPRYEVTRKGRTRIAHVNVERGDLRPDPYLKTLPASLGRGFVLPFPVLPTPGFRTSVLPTPMSFCQTTLPLRIDVFADDGTLRVQRYLGVLPRGHRTALCLDSLLSAEGLRHGGHAELAYDFREGGEADGWLHALFRYEHRDTGHMAESSFGAHIFNTIMTYKSEPQSYGGPPPGLSTKLFLKLGAGTLRTFCVLIYPASAPWHPHSSTRLELHDRGGDLLASSHLKIPCCGSSMIYPSEQFSPAELRSAGDEGYVIVRDSTCRLFGFHGLDDGAGKFAFDHMFGF